MTRGTVHQAMRRAAAVAIVAAIATAWMPARAASRNFLWKIAGRPGVVHLVGSVHLLSKDFYPLNPVFETAYKSSSLLVEEVDLGEMSGVGSQMQLLRRGLLGSSQPLESVLSPSTMTALTKRASGLGMPMEALRQFKPWMIALTIEQSEWLKAGFDPELGLDKHFYNQATADKKKVEGLETIEYQISRFDEMPMELQDHLLAETLKDIDTEQANMSKLIESWRTGDAAAVERIVLKDLQQEPVLYQRLLVERNRNWLPKIEALLGRPGESLVVVGAAHLVGPDGLLSMLKSKGYGIEQR